MFIVKEYKPKTTKNDLRYFKLFTINNSQYIFNEKNMYTIFGLEKVYYDNIFKWCINNQQKKFFIDLEQEILKTIKNYDNSNLNDIRSKTNIIIKDNYPVMIKTFVPNNAYDIIEHEQGDIPSYKDIKKHKKYDVVICINNITVNIKKKEMGYKYLVTKIKESN